MNYPIHCYCNSWQYYWELTCQQILSLTLFAHNTPFFISVCGFKISFLWPQTDLNGGNAILPVHITQVCDCSQLVTKQYLSILVHSCSYLNSWQFYQFLPHFKLKQIARSVYRFGCRLNDLRFPSWHGQETFLFSKLWWRALGLTQPPFQWVQGSFCDSKVARVCS